MADHPAFLLLLAMMMSSGSILSASAGGLISQIAYSRSALRISAEPDPVRIIAMIHWVMLAGWIVAAYSLFGLAVAATVTAAGIIGRMIAADETASNWLIARLGKAHLGELSLAAEAVGVLATMGLFVAFGG